MLETIYRFGLRQPELARGASILKRTFNSIRPFLISNGSKHDCGWCLMIFRMFAIALLSIVTFSIDGAVAAPFDDGRLAIIHADHSVLVNEAGRPRSGDFLKNLRETGVLVIGRYFGRCRQGGFAHKRIVDGGLERNSEANAILDAGLAIISFYQYKTNDTNAVRKFTAGLQRVKQRRSQGV